MDKQPSTSLHELLTESAQTGLRLQDENGTMPAGHNGYYGDPETPVSNTAHWAILYDFVYEITGDEVYRDAAHNAISYLISDSAIPHGVNFDCRNTSKKFRSNGLVGQAWAIEALAELSPQFPDLDLCQIGADVFLRHTFNERLGIWKTLSIDGEREEFDMIFNHQLWFAAAGALLSQQNYSVVESQVRTFLDHLVDNITLYDSGMVFHPLLPDLTLSDYSYLLRTKNGRTFLDQYLYRRIQSRTDDYWTVHSIGYHSFNLYAFGLLHRTFPNHSFWSSDRFRNVLSYARLEQYRNLVSTNKYGFSFNPTGIEVAYALNVFEEDRLKEQQEWLKMQLERCYDPKSGLMSLSTPDRATHAARFYEATRLPNITVECNFLPEYQKS